MIDSNIDFGQQSSGLSQQQSQQQQQQQVNVAQQNQQFLNNLFMDQTDSQTNVPDPKEDEDVDLTQFLSDDLIPTNQAQPANWKQKITVPSQKEETWKDRIGKSSPEQASSNDGEQSFDGTNAQGKSPEEIAKWFQSQYDKTKATLDKTLPLVDELRPKADLYDMLQTDSEIRQAFFAKLEPDLVKPKDMISLVKAKLAEEFKEFVPNREEADIFGSPTYLYNKRANELLSEYQTKLSKIPSSLDEVLQKRKAEADKQKASLDAEKSKIFADLKWDDNKWNRFTKWASTSSLTQFAKMYDFLEKKASKSPNFNTPNLSTQKSSAELRPSQYQAELDVFFGPGSSKIF